VNSPRHSLLLALSSSYPPSPSHRSIACNSPLSYHPETLILKGKGHSEIHLPSNTSNKTVVPPSAATMATSTEQYRQYPPAPADYPAQEHYQQQQYQATVPASPRKTTQNPPAHSRTFSFHSQKSHKSSGSKDLHETHAEKEAKRLHSTADPTFALNEAEPCMLLLSLSRQFKTGTVH
jgi:hypothetical protein